MNTISFALGWLLYTVLILLVIAAIVAPFIANKRLRLWLYSKIEKLDDEIEEFRSRKEKEPDEFYTGDEDM